MARGGDLEAIERKRAEEIMSELVVGRSWSGKLEVRRKDGTTLPTMATDTRRTMNWHYFVDFSEDNVKLR